MPASSKRVVSTQTDARRDPSGLTTWQVRPNAWQPATDIYELDDSLVVKVEVAGLKAETLELSMQNKVLYISGVRADSAERRAYHQMEIPFGKFLLTVELSISVVAERSLVEYKDGFLTIHIPKEK